MPKRSRSRENHNPLSSARKDSSGSNKSKSNSGEYKADQNAQSLWHRKSGAGYHLFVSYYGAQPMGVVIAGDDADVAADTKEGHHAIGDGKNTGGGMSRAAKKRRQKKKSSPSSGDQHQQRTTNNSSLCSNNKEDIPLHQQQQSFDASHPLLQAFASSANINHPHLTRLIHTLSRPLPLTLRFREHEHPPSNNATELEERLSNEYSERIAPVSFDPSNNIYQSTPNSTLCKSNLSKLSPKLKELIVEGSMNGTLARQELGSMLPVLGLRSVGAIKGGSKVLDLCASPGSKTLQALEIVAASGNNKKGRVIANDIHTKRLDSLREAVLRSGISDTLTSRVTYTNYDASIFPSPKSGKLFDAIICDVPCGGDGTIRKDKHILPMWSPNISNALHGLQLKILMRAMELVKVGGVVCYSTCSLNPIEDEAVVSAALLGSKHRNGGDGDDAPSFELLEWPSNMLPGFIRRPGVNDWKVAFYDQDNVDKDNDDFGSLSFYDSYESAAAAGMEDAKSTFWPDLTGNNKEELRLDRCTRLLPQDQDSGGFFLALMKRMS